MYKLKLVLRAYLNKYKLIYLSYRNFVRFSAWEILLVIFHFHAFTESLIILGFLNNILAMIVLYSECIFPQILHATVFFIIKSDAIQFKWNSFWSLEMAKELLMKENVMVKFMCQLDLAMVPSCLVKDQIRCYCLVIFSRINIWISRLWIK